MEDVAQAKINRAARARHLLEDPILMEAFEALAQDADEIRDTSKPGETELREECHRAKMTLLAVRKKLAFWVADGSIEQARLDEEEKRNATNDNQLRA